MLGICSPGVPPVSASASGAEMPELFTDPGGPMNWRLNHGTADAATSGCGRWVITRIDAGRYELWDTKERVVIGVFQTISKAMRAAG
jgi:hypothetical protein